MTAAQPLLRARGIHVRFPGVHALKGVDLELNAGEILAVLGENGAGKSTLMRALAGIHPPDEGQLLLAGEAISLRSPRDAREQGIALVHQELGLVGGLSVAANLFLGRETRGGFLIDHRRQRTEAQGWLDRVGARFGPDTPVSRLSPGECQVVEIAKALSLEPRVLILDEPTSSLSDRESERLFELLRELSGQGVGVVFISHALSEVRALADRAVILRDGERAGELVGEELTEDRMVQLMVGRAVERQRGESRAQEETVLKVQGLSLTAFAGGAIDFELRAGEKLALAGLVGSGRSEVLRCLFGIDRPRSGRIEVCGEALNGGPQDAIARGVGLVPEDRKHQGLLLEQSCRENISVASLSELCSAGMLNHAAERELAAAQIEDLDIRCSSAEQAAGLLSGGNQQKVVLGRWLTRQPKLLLLDEPTRGVDVGARQEIYKRLDELAQQGVAILFASSELEEVLTLADRVLVLHEGNLAGVLPAASTTQEQILALAFGAIQEQTA